ncbi:MAG: hypothetical protein CMP45_03915, partial [Rickettsiales bacterium]|nr:hypothetical protein [Rickettsiales bacterium]
PLTKTLRFSSDSSFFIVKIFLASIRGRVNHRKMNNKLVKIMDFSEYILGKITIKIVFWVGS